MLRISRRPRHSGHAARRFTLISCAAVVLMGALAAPATAASPELTTDVVSIPQTNWGWE